MPYVEFEVVVSIFVCLVTWVADYSYTSRWDPVQEAPTPSLYSPGVRAIVDLIE